MTTPALQRAASLVPLPSLLAELGTGLDAVLDGTGVVPGQLRADAFIPYAAFVRILDNAAAKTGRDDIGLLLGQRQTLVALGPLGSVLRHAATLQDAITRFAAFQSLNSTGGAVYLMRAERDIILGYGVYDPTVQVSPQIYDLVMAVGCRLMAELTGGAVGPAEIFLTRAAPDDIGTYQRVCRCPIRFGQTQTGLLIAGPSLAVALPEANPALHDAAFTRLVALMATPPRDTASHLRHLLRPLLLMGRAGMPDVAQRLGLHPRALRRQLAREGTTFEALKDEVRFAAARDLLMIGDLGLVDIALTLDYATSSAFVHAFQRWSGLPPGRWRDRRLTAPFPQANR